MKDKTPMRYLPGIIIFLYVYLFSKAVHPSREQMDLFTGALYIVFGIWAISKILRFYKEANLIINAVWFFAITLILLSATMLLFDWGIKGTAMGIGALGIILFRLTLQYSFLDNREILK